MKPIYRSSVIIGRQQKNPELIKCKVRCVDYPILSYIYGENGDFCYGLLQFIKGRNSDENHPIFP